MAAEAAMDLAPYTSSLAYYLFSPNRKDFFDSSNITRDARKRHRPPSFGELSRDQLQEFAFCDQHIQVGDAGPAFGPRWKLQVVPVYEGDVFRFCQMVLSAPVAVSIIRTNNCGTFPIDFDGACCVVLTIYTPTDYFLLIHNLPFLRSMLNRAISASTAIFESKLRDQQADHSKLRDHRDAVAFAPQLEQLLIAFLESRHRLPSLCSKPILILRDLTRSPPQLMSSNTVLADCLKLLSVEMEWLSKIIAVCVSCSNWRDYLGGAGDGIGSSNYGAYYRRELRATRQYRAATIVNEECESDEGSSSGADEEASGTERAQAGTMEFLELPGSNNKPVPEQPAPPVRDGNIRRQQTQMPGGAWQSSRIVVVGPFTDYRAWATVVLCAFFFKRGRLLSAVEASRCRGELGAVADDLLPTVLAAAVDTFATTFPIQWCPKRPVEEEILDPRNDEGLVAIINIPDRTVTRYELTRQYAPLTRTDKVTSSAFSTVRCSSLSIEEDQTIMQWVRQALALDNICSPAVYLEERLWATYQRALIYEQLILAKLIEPHNFERAGRKEPDARPDREAPAPLLRETNRGKGSRLEESPGQSCNTTPHLGPQSFQSNGPSPMGLDNVSGLLASPEPAFLEKNKIRGETLLGTEFTPSHAQLLTLMRFNQPDIPQ